MVLMSSAPEWFLYFVPVSADLGDEFDLSERVGAPIDFPASKVGRPFFVNEIGKPHSVLNAYFSSGRMRHRSAGTNRKYAYSLRSWVSFLATQGKEWSDATDEDVLDYMFWRRTDEANPRPVSGSTWAGDAVAVAQFHEWALTHVNGPRLSVRTSAARPAPGNRVVRGSLDLRPATVRKSDVKWLSPAAVERWRDIGTHGLSPDGVERSRWRPRSQWRDAAFVDGLYGSGLRLQEWSSVLRLEIRAPGAHRYVAHRVADACAKNRRGHAYWLRHAVLDSIAGYVETERNDAVRRAQLAGTYEAVEERWIIDATEYRSDDAVTLRRATGEGTRTMRVNDMTPAFRRRVFIEGELGLEPAALWLNEDGRPRPQRAWYRTFSRANARVERAGVTRLRCHPHMLRHSFALKWYAVGRLIWERRAVSADEGYLRDFREQFGDTWMLVQTMLGHADVETTKNVYLEPFRALDVKALLEYGQDELNADVLLSVLQEDPRVRLSDTRAGGTW